MTQQDSPTRLTEYLPKAFARPEQPLNEALKDARQAAATYREWLESIPEQGLHTPLAPGKWSPAEHADHIIKTNQLAAMLMDGCVQGQTMPELEMGYAYPDGRLVTLAPLEPTPGRSRDVLLRDLQSSAQMVESAARAVQAAGKQDVPCVPTGLFAPMTALEAVQLATAHYQRHMPQPAAQA